jgi:hypothetical protein
MSSMPGCLAGRGRVPDLDGRAQPRHLQRIQRDQFLMAQLFQGVLHSGLLSSPAKILSVIGDAARAMTTDTGLTQTGMLQLAGSFHGLSGQDVQFVTAPNIPYPGDPAAEVQFAQPQAHQLFTAIAHDKTLSTTPNKPPSTLPCTPRPARPRSTCRSSTAPAPPAPPGRPPLPWPPAAST